MLRQPVFPAVQVMLPHIFPSSLLPLTPPRHRLRAYCVPTSAETTLILKNRESIHFGFLVIGCVEKN